MKFNLFLYVSGDFNAFSQWTLREEFLDLLRDNYIIMLCSYDTPQEGEIVENYASEFLCSGTMPDPDELKETLRKSIREFLASTGMSEFTLERVKITE